MVGSRIQRTVELKAVLLGLVSNAVERRLFEASRRREKHMVMEAVNEEVVRRMESLKVERLKKSEELLENGDRGD